MGREDSLSLRGGTWQGMKRQRTFRGGIHPPHNKGCTETKQIVDLPPKREILFFPMQQHIGAPCEPLVKVGDRVLVGEKIGDSSAFVSVPVHSSISGKVEKIAPVLTPMGTKSLAVAVKNDGLYEQVEGMIPRNVDDLSPEEIRRFIREAGVVGKGGACFPTAAKLTPPPNCEIDHILINCAECEPYLTCDQRLMVEYAQGIVEGLRIVLRLFPRARGVLTLEDNKPDAIEALGNQILPGENLEVCVVKTKYPQGAEKMLIYSVTGREVPLGKLPSEVGCIVLNTRTSYQIYDIFATGRPVMSRIVTIAGGAVARPGNFRVRLGTSFFDLLDAAGGFRVKPAMVLAGGPMMGVSLISLDVPVIKGTSGFVCLAPEEDTIEEERTCIRCGRCVDVCPLGLMPYRLYLLATRRDYAGFENALGMNCMECGCCSYSCPGKLHLVQTVREGKRSVREIWKKKEREATR